jgi:hypothetical protein
MKFRQKICAQWGTVQHQTKVFYFVALKFARILDHPILTCFVSKTSFHQLTSKGIRTIFWRKNTSICRQSQRQILLQYIYRNRFIIQSNLARNTSFAVLNAKWTKWPGFRIAQIFGWLSALNDVLHAPSSSRFKTSGLSHSSRFLVLNSELYNISGARTSVIRPCEFSSNPS